MTSTTTRRGALAAIVTATCLAIPASASAMPYEPPTTMSDAAQAGTHSKTIDARFPPAKFRGGDAPADHPGASRAQPAPTTIEVVRPERTIVRDADDALPMILSSTALLLVLAGLGITLIRTRMVPRPGRSH
jgi:hypothetical protein